MHSSALGRWRAHSWQWLSDALPVTNISPASGTDAVQAKRKGQSARDYQIQYQNSAKGCNLFSPAKLHHTISDTATQDHPVPETREPDKCHQVIPSPCSTVQRKAMQSLQHEQKGLCLGWAQRYQHEASAPTMVTPEEITSNCWLQKRPGSFYSSPALSSPNRLWPQGFVTRMTTLLKAVLLI